MQMLFSAAVELHMFTLPRQQLDRHGCRHQAVHKPKPLRALPWCLNHYGTSTHHLSVAIGQQSSGVDSFSRSPTQSTFDPSFKRSTMIKDLIIRKNVLIHFFPLLRLRNSTFTRIPAICRLRSEVAHI